MAHGFRWRLVFSASLLICTHSATAAPPRPDHGQQGVKLLGEDFNLRRLTACSGSAKIDTQNLPDVLQTCSPPGSIPGPKPGGVIKIIKRSVDPCQADKGISLYQLKVQYPDNTSWQPCEGEVALETRCQPKDNYLLKESGWAVAIPGAYDVSGKLLIDPAKGTITFSCLSGVVAKCARWGYRPWIAHWVPYHQACTRMATADYCGAGVSFTARGTTIEFGDFAKPPLHGTQAQAHPSASRSPLFEAIWGEKGAICLARSRFDTCWDKVINSCPNSTPKIVERLEDCGKSARLLNRSYRHSNKCPPSELISPTFLPLQ